MTSPNYNIDLSGIHRAVLDCLVAAERCVRLQALHKISNAEITSVANAIKAARAGWAAGGVYANTNNFISAS
jgi:hypothetical protein